VCTKKINAIYSKHTRFLLMPIFGSMYFDSSVKRKRILYVVSVEYFFMSHKYLYRLDPCWLDSEHTCVHIYNSEDDVSKGRN
jgi:hypothetical protein